MRRTSTSMFRAVGCAVVLPLLLGAPALATTAAERCEADKRKAAGQYAFCRLNAAATAIRKGVAPDFVKCDAKLAARWAAIESRAAGSCPVAADGPALQALAGDATADLASAIAGGPALGCRADLLACAAERDACAADVAGCEADVAACQADLAAAALCGNGAIDPGEDCDFGTLNGGTCVSEGFAGGVLSCGPHCAYDISACTGGSFAGGAPSSAAFSARASLTASQRCQANKLKTAAKYLACRLKAEATAIRRGAAPDYGKCDTRYAGKWAAVENTAGGSCPVNGDLAAIQDLATDVTDELGASIAGAPPAGCGGALLTCGAELGDCGGALLACDADLTACQEELTLGCGNGVLDAGEQCDFGTVIDATCADKGFTGGALTCGAGCVLDTGGCTGTRFVDNADGTISDTITGLMWQKKLAADDTRYWASDCRLQSGMPTGEFCQQDAPAQAACAAAAPGSGHCGGCATGGCYPGRQTIWAALADANAAVLSGHGDWRIPTAAELLTIVDPTDPTPPLTHAAFHGTMCGLACNDLADPACSCTSASEFYWTADLGSVSASVFIVSFADGQASDDGFAALVFFNPQHYRFVRGGP